MYNMLPGYLSTLCQLIFSIPGRHHFWFADCIHQDIPSCQTGRQAFAYADLFTRHLLFWWLLIPSQNYPLFLPLVNSLHFEIFTKTCHHHHHLHHHMPSVLWLCWLGIRKSIWPIESWVMSCWCGYLSGVRCNWFAYGPADATATHHLLLH